MKSARLHIQYFGKQVTFFASFEKKKNNIKFFSRLSTVSNAYPCSTAVNHFKSKKISVQYFGILPLHLFAYSLCAWIMQKLHLYPSLGSTSRKINNNFFSFFYFRYLYCTYFHFIFIQWNFWGNFCFYLFKSNWMQEKMSIELKLVLWLKLIPFQTSHKHKRATKYVRPWISFSK